MGHISGYDGSTTQIARQITRTEKTVGGVLKQALDVNLLNEIVGTLGLAGAANDAQTDSIIVDKISWTIVPKIAGSVLIFVQNTNTDIVLWSYDNTLATDGSDDSKAIQLPKDQIKDRIVTTASVDVYLKLIQSAGASSVTCVWEQLA